MEQMSQQEVEEDVEIEDDFENAEEDNQSQLSRAPSTIDTSAKEEIQVVRVGEDKELLEKRRQEQYKKKQ